MMMIMKLMIMTTMMMMMMMMMMMIKNDGYGVFFLLKDFFCRNSVFEAAL